MFSLFSMANQTFFQPKMHSSLNLLLESDRKVKQVLQIVFLSQVTIFAFHSITLIIFLTRKKTSERNTGVTSISLNYYSAHDLRIKSPFLYSSNIFECIDDSFSVSNFLNF